MLRFALLLYLLTLPLFAQAALDPSRGEPGARTPCIADDGTIVFSLWGDLWRRDVQGRCHQLTLHAGFDGYPRIAPDGKSVAFSSDRAGNYDLYLIAIDGGPAARLTFHSAHDFVAGFSEDGNWLYFTSTRRDRHALWRVPVIGGTEELVLDDDLVPGDFDIQDGNILFTHGSAHHWRRGYQGSANQDVHMLRAGKTIPEQLAAFEGTDRNPRWMARGEIIFTRELNRSFQAMHMPAPNEAALQLTSFVDIGVEELRISPDRKLAVFQRDHYLYTAAVGELLSGNARLVPIHINRDSRAPGVEQRTFTSGMRSPHLSADGRVLAFELRGAIWVSSPEGGDARRLTEPGLGDSHPRVSPDGSTIAFQSTRAGNSDLWLIPVAGGAPVQFTTDAANDFFHNWSPDGKAIVFCSERSGNRDIWLQRVGSTQATQLTTDPTSDDDPGFSPDGKLIAFDSARRGNADIWIMDADGRNQRFVIGTPDVEQSPVFSRDGRILYFERWLSGGQSTSLHITTPQGGSEMLLASVGHSPTETPDGLYVIFGGDEQIRTLPAPRNVMDARVIPLIARDTVDLAAERVAIFEEAWSLVNTRFYDDKFHGQDWAAIRAKYLPLVQRSRCIEECYYYVWMAIGRLSASHMGIFGRASGSGVVATADLGALLTPMPGEGAMQVLMVTEIEKGGPLHQAWVREGDYIVAVNGRRPRPGENVFERLDLWQVGYSIRLRVSTDGTMANARDIVVRAETSRQAADRRYANLIARRTETVAESTQGRALYIHLTSMNDENLQRFRALLATPEAEKASGLIIDARGNSGGLSYMEIIDLLVARPYLHIKPRTRPRWKQPRLYWDKPVTVLCDQRSNSGGECFPWAIRTLGRGKVVGERTPGNVIGTAWERLADGSTFGVPTEGYFSMDDTRNLENDGVMPDVRVPMTPRDRVQRLDPQLTEAVRILNTEMPAAKLATEPTK